MASRYWLITMLYDLVIIGGGPAGVAAGIFASRKKIKTLLIAKNFGGQAVISSKIENFIGFKEISGVELSKILEEHLRAQEGIEIKEGASVISIKKGGDGFEISDSAGGVYQSKNILIALGRSYRKLNIPGEKEFEGKGVFYCSICDAPLMKDKKSAVIGGGNSGLGAAIDLLPYASEIYILEKTSFLKGDVVSQGKLKSSSKVKILTDVEVKEIIGDGFVKGLKYKDLKTGEEKILDVSGVFVAAGYQPNSDLVKNLVNLNEKGEIIVDHKTYQASTKGIWAAGDITDGLYNQISIAIGDAIKAVLNIYETLKSE